MPYACAICDGHLTAIRERGTPYHVGYACDSCTRINGPIRETPP